MSAIEIGLLVVIAAFPCAWLAAGWDGVLILLMLLLWGYGYHSWRKASVSKPDIQDTQHEKEKRHV